MPAFVPPAATLLQAAANDLERDVLPALEGLPKFRARIILNVLRLVTRELDLSPAADVDERQRLHGLLGTTSGTLPQLRTHLAASIDSGTLPLDDEAVVDHIRQSLREALAIDSPG